MKTNTILLLMDFDIVNKTICLCAKRNSGKSQLMRYIIMMSKHQFKKNICYLSYRANKQIL